MKKSASKEKLYQKVLELRSKGFSYTKIMNATGIPHTTIRNICKNGIPEKPISRWSSEEDKYLLKMTGEHSENLNHCFALVAKKLGRTYYAVSRHYYESLKPKVMNLKDCSFMLVDNKKINPQTKRTFTTKSNPISIKRGVFQKIKTFIKNLINGE